MKRSTVIGVLGGALVGSFGRPARAATVRLASSTTDSAALMFYANDMGFFKNNGLDVEVQVMPNGEAVTLAMSGGAVDVGSSECVSLIHAFQKGLPFTIIAPGGTQTPTSGPVGLFFVQKDSAISGGRDLNGKTVAVMGLNGFAQFGTSNWIDKTGGDSSTVKFVQFAGAQIGPALQDRRVDGAFVAEPFVAGVRPVARAVADPMASIAPTFLSGAHFSTLAWAKSHPDELRRVQTAFRQAADWSNKNRDKTAVILERIARISPDLVAASVRAYYGERLEPSQLQPLIDIAARYGHWAPFPAKDMMYGV